MDRLLLHVFPAAFRARFADDMTDLFADRHRAAKRQGSFAIAWLWVGAILDVMRAGWSERRADRRHLAHGVGRIMRLESLIQDVTFGLRQVRHNPAFSGIAIATLALGIGVTTAMFSAVDAVLIRPLPLARVGGESSRARPVGGGHAAPRRSRRQRRRLQRSCQFGSGGWHFRWLAP